ncbi:hypothetical protein [Actinomyces sp.]|nr:hypothetical protein [Actinomyces oris]
MLRFLLGVRRRRRVDVSTMDTHAPPAIFQLTVDSRTTSLPRAPT